MLLLKREKLKLDSFNLPGGKHSFAHSIACGALVETCVFENVPNISDAQVLINLLKNIFDIVDLDKNSNKLVLDKPIYPEVITINSEMLGKSRNIFCLIPALLNRAKMVIVSGIPQGCNIGDRPTDWYYEVLQKFGVKLDVVDNSISLTWKQKINADIIFDYPTMTGTVIALACSSIVNGTSTLKNCSVEPSCIDQINCMDRMDIDVEGALPDVIIKNYKKAKSLVFECTSDRVYAVTLLTAGVLSKRPFKVYSKTDLRIPKFIAFLKALNLDVKDYGNSVEIKWKDIKIPLTSVDIDAGSEPKFSSDWVTFALLILATQCNGKSVITDDVFVNRFQFINYYSSPDNFENIKLSKLKTLRPTAVAEISGTFGEKISGGKVDYIPDIRGTAAVVLSTIVASNPVEIFDEFQLSRGYEDLIGTLTEIGFIERN